MLNQNLQVTLVGNQLWGSPTCSWWSNKGFPGPGGASFAHGHVIQYGSSPYGHTLTNHVYVIYNLYLKVALWSSGECIYWSLLLMTANVTDQMTTAYDISVVQWPSDISYNGVFYLRILSTINILYTIHRNVNYKEVSWQRISFGYWHSLQITSKSSAGTES